MPFARFEKLAIEKRERLLEVAAQEFIAYGFEAASLNHILEQAHFSKGGAYYYFEDKVDLFCTVVRHAAVSLNLVDHSLDLATLSSEQFWPTLKQIHAAPLLRSYEKPWLFAVLNVAGRLSPAEAAREPLASLVTQVHSWVLSIIKCGQDLGMLRTDLPADLLFGWMQALDSAADQWLLAHWSELDRDSITRLSDQTVEAMQRTLEPSERK